MREEPFSIGPAEGGASGPRLGEQGADFRRMGAPGILRRAALERVPRVIGPAGQAVMTRQVEEPGFVGDDVVVLGVQENIISL